jgi:hypothetical protein
MAGSACANAQTTAALGVNAYVSLDGLTGTITSLTCPKSGCTAGDQLEVVAVDKDDIEFEIVNSNASSAIFASTGSAETLAVTLGISPTAGYSHALGKAASVTQIATGWQNYTSCNSCSAASAKISSVFNTAVATTPLLDTLAVQGGKTKATQQVNVSTSADNLSTPTSSFDVTATLSLNPDGMTVGKLEFDAFALKLHTAPEPASMSILLISLGGLTFIRRRRLST